jgi:hypothetical protein
MQKLLVSLVTALLLLPLGAAHADQPTPVSGTNVRAGPPRNVTVQEAGGNTIVTSDITQAWSGGISGIAEAHRRQINHPNGEFTTHISTTCTCTVDGVTGTLYLRIQGHSDPNSSMFLGTWTIVGGEGDLADLHGQGTVSQVFPGPSLYEGSVHFEP